jgi:hypothetical protein
MQIRLISVFFLTAIIFCKASFGQDSLVLKTVLDNRIQLLVPKTFNEEPQASIAEKFPDENTRPSVILTDKEELSSIKIIKMPQVVSDKEVASFKAFQVGNMKKEANINWLGDGIKVVNGKTVGYAKLIYKEKNTFSYFFFTSMDGKLLLLNFNCADALWPALEETVEKIVASLKID